MKKLVFIVLSLLTFSACYDDTLIWDKLNDHEERIIELETLCRQRNSNITALQAMVAALQDNDYVTNVTKIMEGGVEVGYTISFSKSGAVPSLKFTNSSSATKASSNCFCIVLSFC